MKVKFSKMQGLGNDFVVLDAVRQRIEMTPERAAALADRHFGIGCDQVLVVEPARVPGTDFHYRIFNASGGEVEQCGNGARCFARFVKSHGLTDKSEIVVSTQAGVIRPRLDADGQVTVDMGCPEFEPARIPFAASARAPTYTLEVDGQRVEISAVALGNPHAVQVVASVERAPVATQGPLIEGHARFPRRVNAGYAEIMGPDEIALRVYERGAGETLACGSGACAAVVALRARGVLAPRVTVHLRGGDLVIGWDGEGHSVSMTGPAVEVFEGEVEWHDGN